MLATNSYLSKVKEISRSSYSQLHTFGGQIRFNVAESNRHNTYVFVQLGS